MSGRVRLVRDPDAKHVSVDFVELYFDLVYVFAVTQVSHFLLTHLGAVGLVQAGILFLAVWWAWTFTAWATNWLNPSCVPVRAMVFCVMLASLGMSASIPDAFGERGLWFALSYVAIQLGRTLYLVWIMWQVRPRLAMSLLRVAGWFVLSAPFWIGGALVEADLRLILWFAAIAIEFLGPLVQFALPVLGRSTTRDYAVSGAHMAERSALFIIVALGEGVLITGALFSEIEWNTGNVLAALVAFAGTVAMWWVYFDVGMRRGVDHIEHDADSGRVARNAYTYSHIPIVAGIIVAAVADEMMLEHPLGHASLAFIGCSLGGGALFLAGTMLFKRVTSTGLLWPLSHLVGLVLFGLAAVWAVLAHPTPLAVGSVAAALLAIVAVWEWGSFHGGWVERGLPVPGFVQRYADWRLGKAAARNKAVSPPDDRG
ncbi:low temperature requirement protein A [Sphingomonas sabuli]|uniref:Low temperature requirement protein A n=1 Tax=Sphingomonas sabuli TaxID=2764186 RepID=A0A7G9L140_9SPHN|nr:low temperature requirement protein A [Sphingomonas sabuli]QNM82339.1 low temperature requirement protein A [Sphingomonas sabuli]